MKVALERQVASNQKLSQEKEQLMFKLRHRDSSPPIHLPTVMPEITPRWPTASLTLDLFSTSSPSGFSNWAKESNRAWAANLLSSDSAYINAEQWEHRFHCSQRIFCSRWGLLNNSGSSEITASFKRLPLYARTVWSQRDMLIFVFLAFSNDDHRFDGGLNVTESFKLRY